MLALFRRYLDHIYRDMVQKRLRAQLDHLGTHGAQVFLDLGCHVGYNTDRVRGVLCPKQTLGLEFDPVSIQEARDRGIDVVRHDLNQPLPLRSNLVDVVTAFDVLEHLVESWQVIVEIHRVLKPGGCVLIDCPNLAAWHNILALVLGLQPFSGPHLISIVDSDLGFVEDMHQRDHDLSAQQAAQASVSKMHRHIVVPAYRSLRRALVKARFEIEGSWGFGYYPFPPVISDLLCKIDISHAHHYIIKARKPTQAGHAFPSD
jgi:SAM-dependent methyltransferase